MADRDEDFNTRFGSYRGWQLAIQKVKPIPRRSIQVSLADMVLAEDPASTGDVVDYFVMRLMRVPVADVERQMLVAFLDEELGTSEIAGAESYLEEPLRMLIHLIMSQPEYQLG